MTGDNQIVLGTAAETVMVPGQLDVTGNAIFQGDVSMNQNLFVGGDVSCNGITSLSAATANTPANGAPGTSIATLDWVTSHTSDTGGGWDVNTNTTTTNYDVGIGTNSPGAALDVSGNMLLHNGTNMYIGSDNNTTTGYGWNTGIGIDALQQNTSGLGNTGIGYVALQQNESGNDNVGIGSYSLSNNTSGDGNICLGKNSLINNTTGDNNVGIGIHSLGNTIGSNNTGIGPGTDVSGNYNYSTAIGYNAKVKASYSTAIGQNAQAEAEHQIVLGTNQETVMVPGQLNVSGNALFQSDVSCNNLYVGNMIYS